MVVAWILLAVALALILVSVVRLRSARPRERSVATWAIVLGIFVALGSLILFETLN